MSGIGVMGEYVKEFCEFAKANLEKRFLVTEIGCGIAGYSIDEVAPLFECCRDVENVTLPASFWDIIGEPSAKEYDLERFVTAQAADYADALDDIRNGRKRGHWILLIHEGKRDIDAIMGSSIDVLKLQTCMNLFNRVSPNDIFEKVLDAFF